MTLEYLADNLPKLQELAKILWPNDEDGSVYWKMHLQRLITSDDPKKYLKDNS